MVTKGEVYVLYYRYGEIDIDSLRQIFEATKETVAPTPIIAIPDCLKLEGLTKSECMNLLLDMMECVQSG